MSAAAAFAESGDVAAVWRALTTTEGAAADSHLESVAALIRAEFAERLDLDDVPAGKLGAAKTVSVDVVKTALETGNWPGHLSYGRNEGPRGKSGTLAVAGGSLELLDWHRRLLGLPVNVAPRWNFPRGDY
ncbi:head-to-tail connector complex protein [Gordonia phage Mulch]|uniref:Head-to-tail connector protein n=5 Tax=Betterkatzvirus betterkatz TaxID=2560485 RepID=A0A2Z5HDJ0_9CAUD|nr:head-to-tail connector protein [Gordonia phage Nadeem]AZS11181.1 head-to-tail connector complex protein [Gordonia phage WheatThin]QAU06810.1 head-to-tail adaptor [Gordonia phage Brylie]QAX92508.1 head-to-tail connector complex protein [Gordonia phage Mulch]QAY06469.1 head-to-tail connector complex protein [Gordonia phage Parada]QXO14153.1 head-to-tail adaptor [Gordonia phage Bock]